MISGIVLFIITAFIFYEGLKDELTVNNEKIPKPVAAWAPIAKKYGRKYGVPADIILSVINVESAGNPSARGRNGEFGLMQLKPIAVKDVRQNMDPETSISLYETDPEENIRVGTLFLKLQHKRAKNWPDAIRAYNQGFEGMDLYPGRGNNYLNKVNRFRSLV